MSAHRWSAWDKVPAGKFAGNYCRTCRLCGVTMIHLNTGGVHGGMQRHWLWTNGENERTKQTVTLPCRVS